MSDFSIFCNNCGNNGHLFYQCKKPITSIGILLFTIENNIIKYLCIRRKDSLGYVDFMRGKYNIYNKHHLLNILNEMTTYEKENLVNNDFQTLWINLWGTKEDVNNEYVLSYEKFITLKKGILLEKDSYNLESLLKQCDSKWKEPEWGFPKGRRNYREKDLETAIRETNEETGYKTSDIDLIENLYPFEEIFTGSNFKSYKHKYYLGYISYEKTLKNNNFQKNEISKMEWKNFEQTLNCIRPYNIEKKEILKKCNRFLKQYKLCL